MASAHSVIICHHNNYVTTSWHNTYSLLCSGSYIRPTLIVHSCSQYFSIIFPSRYLFYMHYSDHVCIFLQSRIVFPRIVHPRIFNATWFFFTSRFHLVESRRLHNFLSRLYSSVPFVSYKARQLFLCRVHRAGSFPVERYNHDPTWRLILRWELPVSSFR